MKYSSDLELVKIMIRMYCKAHHHPDGYLCKDCEELFEYVKYRTSVCPFKDNKPFCANCKVHCYTPEMRERIRQVMKYSGPRISFVHPIVGFSHLNETIKTKIKNKKLEKIKQKKIALALQKKAELDKQKALEAEKVVSDGNKTETPIEESADEKK